MQIYYFGIKFASNFVKGDYDKMTKFIDYYKILGVKKDIPQDEVKAAYRKRSKQFHPDLHPNDPKAKAKFQLLNEAYEVINDPEKRKLYDQYGENWDKAQGMGGMNGAGGFSGFEGFGGSGFGNGGFDFNFNKANFSDFFSEFMGGMHQQPQQPTEVKANISIDMFTAALGGDVFVAVDGHKYKIKIKPGTQPGSQMRLRGKGGIGANGVKRDLIITINISIPTNLTEKQREVLESVKSVV